MLLCSGCRIGLLLCSGCGIRLLLCVCCGIRLLLCSGCRIGLLLCIGCGIRLLLLCLCCRIRLLLCTACRIDISGICLRRLFVVLRDQSLVFSLCGIRCLTQMPKIIARTTAMITLLLPPEFPPDPPLTEEPKFSP